MKRRRQLQQETKLVRAQHDVKQVSLKGDRQDSTSGWHLIKDLGVVQLKVILGVEGWETAYLEANPVLTIHYDYLLN